MEKLVVSENIEKMQSLAENKLQTVSSYYYYRY